MLTPFQARQAVRLVIQAHQAERRRANQPTSIFPVFCEDQAKAAEQIEEWWLAHCWWEQGSTWGLSAGRALRYMEASKACADRARAVQGK